MLKSVFNFWILLVFFAVRGGRHRHFRKHALSTSFLFPAPSDKRGHFCSALIFFSPGFYLVSGTWKLPKRTPSALVTPKTFYRQDLQHVMMVVAVVDTAMNYDDDNAVSVSTNFFVSHLPLSIHLSQLCSSTLIWCCCCCCWWWWWLSRA